VDETRRSRLGRDRLLHVASGLGAAMCRQPVRRRRRQLLALSVSRPARSSFTSHDELNSNIHVVRTREPEFANCM